MSEFKPGQPVLHKDGRGAAIPATFVGYDEGWCLVEWDSTQSRSTIRPSELTPADPVPDAAVMLVRELVAQEYEARGNSDIGASCRAGRYDNVEEETAFAKYIRANSLTVERVREAFNKTWPTIFASDDRIERFHAALTEPRA